MQKLIKISGGKRWSDHSLFVKKNYPNWQLIYPITYIAGFWCGNILLIGNFKNARAYQNMWGQQVVRPLLLYLEKSNQTDS